MKKRYAITGSGSGIGAAVAQVIQSMDADIITIDLKDADICADLSTTEGCNTAIAELRQRAPDGLDGLVTCAGVGPHYTPVSTIGSLNYYGTVLLVEGAKPLLAERQGAVVVVSSNSAVLAGNDPAFDTFVDSFLEQPLEIMHQGVAAMEGQAVYAGSKLALMRWVRKVAPQWIGEGVRVNAIAPGITTTPLTAAAKESSAYGERMQAFEAMVPAGGSATPEQIAGPIAFLLSYAANYMVGSILFADGGIDARLRPKSV